ncbi:EF-hand domain-containing protein [Haloferula sp. BvORR071]|uniref:EF-hand domain-containing protein n=1 Tax=Haloferula sp. BvORR071 TaxID=1396141 RepID=UPI0006975BF2|nr:EF-hand domain-containing protein [Haloferula sp. BvORR071]
MKTKITWIALALAAGTLGVHAQEEGGQRRGPGNRQLPPEIIKEYDKDGDGKLSDDETKAMREAMQARRAEQEKKDLEEFDKDKDGKLNDEETKALREARQAKRKALIEKYDTDKDGKVSPEEAKAATPEERMALRGGMGPGGRGGEGGQGGGRRGGRGGENQPKPEEKKAGE